MAFKVLRRLVFSVKMKTLADKKLQIVTQFAKRPIYVTVSFKEECNSRWHFFQALDVPVLLISSYTVRSTPVASPTLYTYVTLTAPIHVFVGCP